MIAAPRHNQRVNSERVQAQLAGTCLSASDDVKPTPKAARHTEKTDASQGRALRPPNLHSRGLRLRRRSNTGTPAEPVVAAEFDRRSRLGRI